MNKFYSGIFIKPIKCFDHIESVNMLCTKNHRKTKNQLLYTQSDSYDNDSYNEFYMRSNTKFIFLWLSLISPFHSNHLIRVDTHDNVGKNFCFFKIVISIISQINEDVYIVKIACFEKQEAIKEPCVEIHKRSWFYPTLILRLVYFKMFCYIQNTLKNPLFHRCKFQFWNAITGDWLKLIAMFSTQFVANYTFFLKNTEAIFHDFAWKQALPNVWYIQHWQLKGP